MRERRTGGKIEQI